MGTNYYTPAEPPCPHCGKGATELHIGKLSAGWAFCFAPYPEHGLTSWAAWRDFLKGREIKDEYGDTTSLEALAELVEGAKQLWTHVSCPDSAWGPYKRRGSIDAAGYRFNDTADFS